jgi:hypothetical protein
MKRKPIKRKGKKRPVKTLSIKTTTKKGSNIVKVQLAGKPENVAKKLEGKTTIDKKLSYYQYKNKNKQTGKYIPPKAIVAIYEVRTPEGETKVFSEISEPDFVVKPNSAKNFLVEQTKIAEQTFKQNKTGSGGIDGFKSIKSVSFKYIY